MQLVSIPDGDKITCIIADETMGWVLEIAKKMRIKVAAFWPASALLLAQIFYWTPLQSSIKIVQVVWELIKYRRRSQIKTCQLIEPKTQQ